jgi:short-subunit dehydrogenase involved in D-alanine esterification of teichoic acids
MDVIDHTAVITGGAAGVGPESARLGSQRSRPSVPARHDEVAKQGHDAPKQVFYHRLRSVYHPSTV